MPQRGRQFHGDFSCRLWRLTLPLGGIKLSFCFTSNINMGETHSPFQHDSMLIPTTWGKLATLELPPWKLCLQDSSALSRCPLSLSRGHGTVLPQLILGPTIIALFLILGRWELCFYSSSVQRAISEQRNNPAMLAGH